MNPFVTYIAGITFHDGLDVIESIPIGTHLRLLRDPYNPYDANAILIYHLHYKLGYIPRTDADRLARLIDNGILIGAELVRVSKSGKRISTGIKIFEGPSNVEEVAGKKQNTFTNKEPQFILESAGQLKSPILRQAEQNKANGCLGLILLLIITFAAFLVS
ncbi:HIRAN domain-containing protein [Spirosoma sp.]|uniref:HIRAN domain-containing protein n=1 Tax=Spirosoma sp. TaxID=1899569 RepID=UPI003B3A4873